MHLEKSLLYLKKWEVPEGGVFKESTVFDTNSMYMSDIFLIHGKGNLTKYILANIYHRERRHRFLYLIVCCTFSANCIFSTIFTHRKC